MADKLNQNKNNNSTIWPDKAPLSGPLTCCRNNVLFLSGLCLLLLAAGMAAASGLN